MQFTFGLWQDQQLKQQQRSVISGSSNSNSNSATLRALQFMPVNLTSDLERNEPNSMEIAAGSLNGGSDTSSGEEDSAITEEQWRANKQRAKELKKAQNKRVSLRWPSTYSYCLQHVRSQCWDGYYCPPAPLEEEIQRDALDAGVFGVPSENAKNEWLCIYRPIT